MHSTVTGSEQVAAAADTHLNNKQLRQGYDTLTQRNDKLLDVQSQQNQGGISDVFRLAQTGLSTHMGTCPNGNSLEDQKISRITSRHFFSRDNNRRILNQEPKYINGGKYSIRKRVSKN